MAYATSRERLVLFGGVADAEGGSQDDTWEWDGTVWTRLSPSDEPTARFNHAMAYDAARERVVLFGGFDGVSQDDTWVWDGSSWSDLTPPSSSSPPGRTHHAMAYDAARERVVLFGGFTGDLERDTWVWDGSTWDDVTPAAAADSPSAREAAAMAYDPNRQRVVLFGGDDGEPLDDTWEWDGSTWTEVTPQSDPPPPRLRHAMTFSVSRGRVVLFGGSNSNGKLGDTWEWDGSTWTEVTPSEGDAPSARNLFDMAYDATREEVVLFGGSSDSGQEDDTWAWRNRDGQ